jgi:hypothetical protein
MSQNIHDQHKCRNVESLNDYVVGGFNFYFFDISMRFKRRMTAVGKTTNFFLLNILQIIFFSFKSHKNAIMAFAQSYTKTENLM